MSARPHFLEPLLRGDHAGHVLRDEQTGLVVARSLEGAFDSKTRTRGLLGRAGLPLDAVMIIAPCNSIHTFFMQFAIDVVFADRDGKILKISRALKPWRIAFAWGAFATLEFAAGAADRSGLMVGGRLIIGAEGRAAAGPSRGTPPG
jgi:hypothetical protein